MLTTRNKQTPLWEIVPSGKENTMELTIRRVVARIGAFLRIYRMEETKSCGMTKRIWYKGNNVVWEEWEF